jgi:hypothetical protein
MKKPDQNGFITMIVVLLAIILAAIVFVYLRVQQAQR